MARQANLKQDVYMLIKNKILWGKLPQGTPLREVQLAEEFNVSRTPVREAVAQLVQDGIVESLPGRGTIVKKFNARDIQDLYELREQLELFSLKKLIPTISTTALGKLRECCESFRTLKQKALVIDEDEDLQVLVREMYAIDMNFHLQLLLNSQNRYVRKVTSDLHVASQISIFSSLVGVKSSEEFAGNLEEAYLRHGEMIDAIEDRDCEKACQLISEHLQSACKRVISQLRKPKSSEKSDWMGEVNRTLQMLNESI